MGMDERVELHVSTGKRTRIRAEFNGIDAAVIRATVNCEEDMTALIVDSLIAVPLRKADPLPRQGKSWTYGTRGKDDGGAFHGGPRCIRAARQLLKTPADHQLAVLSPAGDAVDLDNCRNEDLVGRCWHRYPGPRRREHRLRNRCCDGRHRASSMSLRAGWDPHPHAPWRVRAGRPSKRGDLVREAGDVVAERRGLRRTHARSGLLPSPAPLRTPGIPGEV